MPHKFCKYLFLLGCVLRITYLSGQQYYFKNYSTESGLPFVQVFCMIQDSKGYLWSGGYGGLSRFDGKEFLNFSQKNGLANHYVNALCEGDSAIFVGTENGLSILKDNKIVANYDLKNGLPDKVIKSFCFLGEKGVLIGTKKGLCLFKNNKFYPVTDFNNREIKCMVLLGNTVWVGTNFGLFKYNHINGTIGKQEGLDDSNINCLEVCEGENKVLVGTSGGFAIVDEKNKNVNNFHIANGLVDENINSVFCRGTNDIWIGSNGGLLNFNGKEFKFYNVFYENNSNHIRCIIRDYEDNIWLGTHSGLYRYRDNAFSTFKEGSIANAVIFQIFRDSKNDLWLCSENGIYKYSQGFFKRYTTEDGITHNVVNSAFEDNDGTIWFCTSAGITWYKNGVFREYIPAGGLQLKGPLTVVYKDRQGIIWVGGKNGTMSFKRSNGSFISTFYQIPTLTQEYGVTAFAEDKDGGLWMGTFLGGIFKFENGSFVYKNKSLNIQPESYFMLTCDKYNVLYGATLNGLWVYDIDNNTQQIISEKEGLNSELLYTIRLDHTQDEIWIGTNQGINKLDLDKLRTSNIIDITSYGKAEGFPGGETNSYGIWQDKDGTWWHGTVSGVVCYQPKAFKKNEQPNKTYITSVRLQNQDTVLKSGGLFPYNFNNLTFYYRGICLTNPDKVKYSKKLEGYENKWSEPSSEDYSKYANLPPGKYTFKVKSCNNEGIWNPIATEFVFEIKTPFFKTWWFITGLIAMTIAVIMIIFRIRVQNIRKKEKDEFDKKVEIAKVELKALRAQMNPHFVFNSLNSIQHYILNSKSNEAAKYLNKFAKLIRTILSNSEKSMVTVNEDIESLRLYLELEQMRFDGKFDYSINVEKGVDGDYDEIPPMLMQPYIENAILHGLNPKETKGHLKIDIFTKNNYIVCRISDDGIGRDRSGEIKRTQPGQQHKSLGMKITSERVRILNDINKSDLSVAVTDLRDENGNPAGTMVELYIPHFN